MPVELLNMDHALDFRLIKKKKYGVSLGEEELLRRGPAQAY